MSASVSEPREVTRHLWRIAETGEVGQLQELLARGADVNARHGGGVTPLMIAAYYGRIEMVRALTDHGADVNLVDRDGFTAAMLAHHSGHEEIVRTLIARGAKMNPSPVTVGTAAGPLETFDRFSEAKVTTGGNLGVRTLHAPPNIWDVVHETRARFDPRSAFIGHLPAASTIGLAVITLLTVGLAVLGFMKFNGLLEHAPAARSVTPAASTVMEGATSSLAQQPAAQTNEPVRTESPAPQPAESMPVSNSLVVKPVKSATAAAVTPAHPDKRSAAPKPARLDRPSPTTTGATILSTDNQANKDKAQEVSAPKVDLALPQADSDKSTEPNEVKKPETKKNSDKSPTPSSVAPKASPTPNLR